MKINKITILLILLSFSLLAFSAKDEPKLLGSSKSVVRVGERFKIVYELNADGSRFKSPNFGKFRKLSGPNKSSNSSIQYINGNYQQSYSQTYSFIVTATKEGNFTIPPASILVKGKTIVSNSITIKVSKGNANNSSTQQRNKGNSSQAGVLQKDDVYIKTIVSNNSPYLGEQVIVTNRIYTKIPISNLSFEKAPSFQGFWSKSLSDENTKLKQSTQIINGEEYIVADISKYAIFPQKSGEIIIEPNKNAMYGSN